MTDALFSFNDILMIVTWAPNIYLACFVSPVGVWDEGWGEGTGSPCNCSPQSGSLTLILNCLMHSHWVYLLKFGNLGAFSEKGPLLKMDGALASLPSLTKFVINASGATLRRSF